MSRKPTDEQEQLINLALAIIDEHKSEHKKRRYLKDEIKDNKYRLVISEDKLKYCSIPISMKQIETRLTFTANRIGIVGYEIVKITQPHNYISGDYIIDFDLKKVE